MPESVDPAPATRPADAIGGEVLDPTTPGPGKGDGGRYRALRPLEDLLDELLGTRRSAGVPSHPR